MDISAYAFDLGLRRFVDTYVFNFRDGSSRVVFAIYLAETSTLTPQELQTSLQMYLDNNGTLAGYNSTNGPVFEGMLPSQ